MIAWQSIQTTVDWIEDHLADELTVCDLAGVACLSPYYFQRLFKRMVGKPVMEYVRLRRLARVSDRLIFNDDTILESCMHYGFESHEVFCRAFKSAYGMTPSECRKLLQAVNKFSKPILTEKGCYVMDYEVNIEELGEIQYLAIPQMLPMAEGDDQYGKGKMFWEQCVEDGSFERLKQISGSDTIYALFCNIYDPATNMASYDFACINRAKAVTDELQTITLRPSKYAVFSCKAAFPMTINQAYWRFNDIFWGEWLPKTDYKSVIDYDHRSGSASIELFAPFKPYADDAPDFSVKIWYPVANK
jgi:AraC-like DNA-binding protein/predicted transcriptional regulator YdeE